ncbi:Hypothetical_protein [Hexamita inflata]|uniref:Hypothetical_protein n=1 Tax=Hexamita inflata TaxID=28002 RepID=A0AA86UHK7_9EUKA|nr:Hypothetical protein HINF_LOCUS39841 [Hexamita inflata]
MFPKYLQTCRQPCKHAKLIYFPYASRQSVGYHNYHQHSQHQIVLNTYLDFYNLTVSPAVTFCSQMFSGKYYHCGLEKIQYRLEPSYIDQFIKMQFQKLLIQCVSSQQYHLWQAGQHYQLRTANLMVAQEEIEEVSFHLPELNCEVNF